MTQKPELLGYIVSDTPYNREFFPYLIGRGFAAPPGYEQILPYRSIKTEGFYAIPKAVEPEKSDPILETIDPSWADDGSDPGKSE